MIFPFCKEYFYPYILLSRYKRCFSASHYNFLNIKKFPVYLIGNFYFSKKIFGSAENRHSFLLSKVGSNFPIFKN
nr:MAG TPA_asm: hypothetical protein [Caudoviricetes sp.]